MVWRLVEKTGSGDVFYLRPGQWKLGRAVDNNICISDPTVSRLQCLFDVWAPQNNIIIKSEFEETGITLTEKSRFGSTFINGQQVKPNEVRHLEDGMQIKFGQHKSVWAVEYVPMLYYNPNVGSNPNLPSIKEAKEVGMFVTAKKEHSIDGIDVCGMIFDDFDSNGLLDAVRAIAMGIPIYSSSWFSAHKRYTSFLSMIAYYKHIVVKH